LGDTEAHYQLSNLYQKGEGVEMNKKKELCHLEKAAIGGHPIARYNLGCEEIENCSIERAVKHCIIAANLGYGIAFEQS
jgi:TPR repeat protein